MPNTLEPLLESSLLTTLLENTPDFVYFKDRQRRFVRFSKAFEGLLGRSAEEIAGKRDEDLFPTEIAANTVRDDRGVIEQEIPIVNKLEGGEVTEGRETWVLTTKIPWRDDDGTILGLFGISRDVSKRKAMEDRLRESERQLRQAQAIGRLGSWTLDLETQRVSGSDELYRVFELDRSETSLQAFAGRVVLADRDRQLERVRAAIESGEPFELEERLELPDGSERFIHVKGEVLTEDARESRRLIGTVQDITERRHAEANRLLIERRLQQTQKLESLGVLAGGLAHDFNNLLSAMYGFLDLAESALPEGSAAVGHIGNARLSAQHAADLVSQLLAYAGKSSLKAEEVDLNEVIHSIRALFGPSISKKTSLSLDLSQGLPRVRGDAAQLRQVVMNLVANASEALGEEGGEIVLATRSRVCAAESLRGLHWGERLSPGEYVVLEVSDSGQGMDEETLTRMFDPFFTTKLPGRGLGLAAVQGIVRGCEGAVSVESEEGRGTTFSLFLPASGESEGWARGAEGVPSAGTVLLVDDEKVLRDLGRQLLAQLGLDTVCARDGFEAIELFAERGDEFLCVLLDFAMPRLNGQECFKHLQQIRSDVPVVLCSGYHDPGARDEGFAGFLKKPFGLADLEQVLKGLVGIGPNSEK